MINPKHVCLFQPSELKDFKRELFTRIGYKILAAGGQICVGDAGRLKMLPDQIIPIIGCSTYLRDIIDPWIAKKRPFIYWDRGYARRVFATALPTGSNGGYYRWQLNAYQMQKMRDVPDDRWKSLNTAVAPWQKNGKHIVIAAPSRTYAKFHKIEGWLADTIDALAKTTGRQLVIRDKEHVKTRPLQMDLEEAHALVTHGSNAAVESVKLGTPVFVDRASAAALVGLTDLKQIENPVYPDRQQWLNNLAYNQWNEQELVDGTLWRMLGD